MAQSRNLEACAISYVSFLSASNKLELNCEISGYETTREFKSHFMKISAIVLKPNLQQKLIQTPLRC